MKYFKGDLLGAFKCGEVQDILHQVNCQGVMGAGIAKQIRKMCPKHYEGYKDHIEYYEGLVLGTTIVTYSSEFDGYVYGLFGQENYGRDGKRHTNYAALISALEYCGFYNKSRIGVPKYMGCGLAGGDWDIVETLLKDFEELNNVEFWVYEL